MEGGALAYPGGGGCSGCSSTLLRVYCHLEACDFRITENSTVRRLAVESALQPAQHANYSCLPKPSNFRHKTWLKWKCAICLKCKYTNPLLLCANFVGRRSKGEVREGDYTQTIVEGELKRTFFATPTNGTKFNACIRLAYVYIREHLARALVLRAGLKVGVTARACPPSVWSSTPPSIINFSIGEHF